MPAGLGAEAEPGLDDHGGQSSIVLYGQPV